MLSVFMLSVVMLSDVMLNVTMLNAVMLNIIMPNVIMPFTLAKFATKTRTATATTIVLCCLVPWATRLETIPFFAQKNWLIWADYGRLWLIMPC